MEELRPESDSGGILPAPRHGLDPPRATAQQLSDPLPTPRRRGAAKGRGQVVRHRGLHFPGAVAAVPPFLGFQEPRVKAGGGGCAVGQLEDGFAPGGNPRAVCPGAQAGSGGSEEAPRLCTVPEARRGKAKPIWRSSFLVLPASASTSAPKSQGTPFLPLQLPGTGEGAVNLAA